MDAKEFRKKITDDEGKLRSRLIIDEELEKAIQEEERLAASKPQEFILYPVGFAIQEEFSKAVGAIWQKGFRAKVVLSEGEREP